MTQEIRSLLEQFKSAIEDEAYDDAESLLDDLHDIYEQSNRARVADRAAAAAKNEDVDFADTRPLQMLSGTDSRTTFCRGGFFANAALFLSNPSELDHEQMIEYTEQLLEHERELEEARDAAEPVLNRVTVPPTVEIRELILGDDNITLGTQLDIEVLVENVGDEPASSVSLEFDPSAGVSLSSQSIDVGTLDADETERVTITAVSEEPDEQTISVMATTSGSDPVSDQRTFEVIQPLQIAVDALRSLATVAELISETEALPRHPKEQLLAEIEVVFEYIQEVAERIEDSSGAVPDAIDDALSSLEDVRSHFDQLTVGADPVCDPAANDFRQSVYEQIDAVHTRLNELSAEVET
ncbi:CARDB domain-containing protein [Natrarchaeobius sp. A-rgal3]|uniref:CARDB domain-containing protein n=1 Tax=Natrarchaeobius versutus TaxID=1679078 RepID=UPI00350FF0D5